MLTNIFQGQNLCIMSHKVIGDKVVVDWTTGDPEGDRINVLAAYRDFIKEIETIFSTSYLVMNESQVKERKIREVFEKWNVSTDNQIDEVPRIWIKRPE